MTFNCLTSSAILNLSPWHLQTKDYKCSWSSTAHEHIPLRTLLCVISVTLLYISYVTHLHKLVNQSYVKKVMVHMRSLGSVKYQLLAVSDQPRKRLRLQHYIIWVRGYSTKVLHHDAKAIKISLEEDPRLKVSNTWDFRRLPLRWAN